MRLYTFEYEDQSRLGAQWKTQLVDLAIAYRILLERKPPESATGLKRLPTDLLRFLQLGTPALDAAREALTFASRRPAIPVDERLLYSFDEIRLRAPLPHPGKILCTTGISGGWFAKMPSTVIGPSDPITQPFQISQLHCQARLGVVIGKRARATPEAEAMSCVAGFTILNDISSQTADFRHEQDFISRNFDTFCPMGPCLISIDELPRPDNRKWRMTLNGEAIQSGSIGEAIASIPKSLQEISKVMTLEAGDIVGLALRAERALDLNVGDISGIEIDGIGCLENRRASLP